MDAIRQLRQDHERVRRLFAQAKRAQDDRLRAQLITQIIKEMEVHAKIEENLFYPACEKIFSLRAQLQDAYIDHQHIRLLTDELSRMRVSSRQTETRLSLLIEIVELHLIEEERGIFPVVMKAMTSSELETLGEDIDHARDEFSVVNAYSAV